MIQWIKEVFTAGSGTSFARCSTAVTTLVGCWAVVHVVLKTHALPDALALTGLAGWMTAPYAISKASTIFAKDGPQPGTIASVQASSANPSVFSRQEKLLAALIIVSLLTLIVVLVRSRS